MSPEQAAALRAPFAAPQIGKLPKPYKKDSAKGNCNVCGGYHGLPAVHLDYVGHAATTDRLLQVDPDWTWEPLALTPDGLPALDRAGNLWIRLTVAGVTRIGVGDGNNAKECIGDALRNAAMRFGVALDLWAKEDLRGGEEQKTPKTDPEAKPETTFEKPDAPPPNPSNGGAKKVSKEQHAAIGALIRTLKEAGSPPPPHYGDQPDWVEYTRAYARDKFGVDSRADLTSAQASQLIDHLQRQEIPF